MSKTLAAVSLLVSTAAAGTDYVVELRQLAPYPGYTGPLKVAGKVDVVFEAGSTVSHTTFNLRDVDPDCVAAGTASNSCGIHIHSGKTCADAGGHLYEGATDPWKTVVYVANEKGRAEGSLMVDSGMEYTSIGDRVMVIHDHSGARIACQQMIVAEEDWCAAECSNPNQVAVTTFKDAGYFGCETEFLAIAAKVDGATTQEDKDSQGAKYTERFDECCVKSCKGAVAPCEWLGGGAGYSYDGGCGPAFWKDQYVDCSYTKQSPINIVTDDSRRMGNDELPSLDYRGYNDVSFTATNTGHGIEMYAEFSAATMSGGPLGANHFNLSSVTFKWGSSEHTIDGKVGDGEIIFEHVIDNEKPATAGYDYPHNYPGGLANLAVIIKEGDSNAEIQKVIDVIGSLTEYGSSVSGLRMSLTQLLPNKFFTSFYSYAGSLTEPPCSESVNWIVARKSIEMSSSQLESLQTLTDVYGDRQMNNARPTQDIGLRYVTRSF